MGSTWGKKLQGKIEAYEFELGILDDADHYQAKHPKNVYETPDTKTYAGGPASKMTRDKSGMSIAEIFIDNMKRLNIDLLRRPFKERNDDIIKFTQAFLKMALSENLSIKRVENLLQAIVRNPILRQEYGRNSSETADAKGFDRHLIDTAQTFKAIKARARRV